MSHKEEGKRKEHMPYKYTCVQKDSLQVHIRYLFAGKEEKKKKECTHG